MRTLLPAFVLLLFACATFSQTVTPPSHAVVNHNYRNYVNQVFGALEPGRVPTGLLLDYAFDFASPKLYNGSYNMADTTLMEPVRYGELYKTLYTSRFNTTVAGMRHPTVHDSLCYIARQKNVITLNGLLYAYNAIDPNAQANGTLQTINGQLKDRYVNGVWQNPYQNFITAAIAPSTIRYTRTYCSVKLPANLFMSNMAAQINTIQFDAGDGQGYRPLPYDVNISLSYADTGWKHWVFKINLVNGQAVYSHSKVYFSNTSNAAGGGTARGVVDEQEPITAAEMFQGVAGIADIYISYRTANVNDRVLRRPLIVAEGFDAGHIINPEAEEGDNDFDDFITSVGNSGSGRLFNLIANPLNPNAASEYDLVYVNWRNGTDYLQRNAFVLEAVIRWVNQNKQPDLITGLRNPNVVLGSSMGGVIARMALGRMERGEGPFNVGGGFNTHETSLYVSLDAPHQGANVPLGYQAAARHAQQMYMSLGGLTLPVEAIQLMRQGLAPLELLTLADQPAAKQLLTNRIGAFFNTSNTVHQAFMQELRTQWALPRAQAISGIRSIAIANGSECAIDQEFAPGSNLLFFYNLTELTVTRELFTRLAAAGVGAGNINAAASVGLSIPTNQKIELKLDIKALANGGGNQVYDAELKAKLKILWFVPVNITIASKTYHAPTGLLPFDTYPGGYYVVNFDAAGFSLNNLFFVSQTNSFIQHRFSFIPTTSALDIGGGATTLTNAQYTAPYVGAAPPATPFNTPFANFTTAFNTNGAEALFANNTNRRTNNERHEIFRIRTANWLVDEMGGNTGVLTDCRAFCANNTITGNTEICTQQSFSVPFNAGAVYTWVVDDPALVTRTPNANTVLLTRNGTASGVTTLRVTITGDCSTTPVVLQTPIIVGNPMPLLQFANTDPLCINERAPRGVKTVTVTNIFANTNYRWRVNGVLRGNGGTTFNIINTWCVQGTNTVEAESFRCGFWQSSGLYEFEGQWCPPEGGRISGFVITPNPVQSNLIISENKTKAATSGKAAGIKEIHIANKTGIIVYRQTYAVPRSSLNIPVAGLKNDLYYVRIWNGQEWETLQFSKE
jgi:hypothetical protein